MHHILRGIRHMKARYRRRQSIPPWTPSPDAIVVTLDHGSDVDRFIRQAIANIIREGSR